MKVPDMKKSHVKKAKQSKLKHITAFSKGKSGKQKGKKGGKFNAAAFASAKKKHFGI